MKSGETISDTFTVGKRAEKIFESLLSAGSWLIRRQDPDFHLDYVIELVDAGEPTGINFGVQLKGTLPKSGNPIRLRYSLKTKHLRYYFHKVTIPVFLVLIDVVSGEGYWCFTQKYVRESVSPSRLREKGTITIPFSEENRLKDLDKLRQAVQPAIDYVKDMHPGSIHAAVAAEKAKLERIDPRLSIDIATQNGRQHFTLNAKEQFAFKVKCGNLDTPESRRGFVDFVEKGTELRVRSSALQFEGAPLFAHLLSHSEADYVSLKYARELSGAMQVFEAEASTFVFQIDGKFECGTKYATFSAAFRNSALSFTATFSAESLLKREPHTINLSFKPDKWAGLPLLLLPHFNEIHRFITMLKEHKAFRLHFHVGGNDLFKAKSEMLNLDNGSLQGIFDLLEFLRKARFIALKYHLNPVMPRPTEIPGVEIEAVEDVYDLINGLEVRRPQPNFRLAYRVSGQIAMEPEMKPGIMRIINPKPDFGFFGSKIELGPLSHFFTCSELASATPSPTGGTDVVFQGSAVSELIMKLEAGSALAGIFPSETSQPEHSLKDDRNQP